MARQARDARLETREARRRLAVAHEPYWRQIHPGLFIGYRKGETGGTWIARLLEGGRYRKRRLGIADDHQDADGESVLTYAQASRKTLAIAEGDIELPDAGKGAYTVADAMADYLDDFKVRGRDHEGAQQRYRKHIEAPLGHIPLRRLTAERLRTWRNALVQTDDSADADVLRGRKATANRTFTLLRAALNFAFRNEKIDSDKAWRQVQPFEHVDVPKVAFITPDEARRLLNGCEPDFRALVHGALLTGMRYGELIELQVQDVDPAGWVFVRRSKSGKARHVPLTPEGAAFFARQIAGKARDALVFTRADGDPWQRAHQHRRIKAACAAARIDPPISFHILRHSYGSALVNRGVSLKVVAEALGHADTRMTERHYGHLARQTLADQVRANLPSFGDLPETNVASIGAEAPRP